MERTQESLERYESRSAAVLVTLAFVFLGLYATQILWMSAPRWALAILGVGQVAIWIVFLADFAYRVHLAPNRARYVASRPLDVITLILPMFRPLRALRIFAAARILIDRGHNVSYGRVATAIVVTAGFITLVGALVVLEVERSAPDSNITTFGDALWWASVTLTTVGYGDYFPVTPQGRASAVAMMAIGISLLGAVTATFAAWFTERMREPEEDAIEALTAQIQTLRAEIAATGTQEAPVEPAP